MLHLDASMHNKYNGVAHKLREWEGASHVERTPRRAKETPAADPVTPSAPSALIAA